MKTRYWIRTVAPLLPVGLIAFFLGWGWESLQTMRREIASLTASPFSPPTLDWEQAGDGPRRKPDSHALYVVVCEPLAWQRGEVVSKDTEALVGRSISGPNFLQNLSSGLEHFTVKKNPNLMEPKLIAASNWPRYQYLDYSTFLLAFPLTSLPQPMQDVVIYIIDFGQKVPEKPGDPVPKGPGPHDPPQPSCPISSATPPPAEP